MFSLRQNLIEHQGVTTEEAVKRHLENCLFTIKHFPQARAHRYRVDANVPNDASKYSFVS